jgi:DNA-binding NarL/FixJ family response regulator
VSYGTSADLAHAVINGATGVLLKNAPTHDLPQAIRRVFAGEKVLSDELHSGIPCWRPEISPL